ncbi:DUF2177 family protein [Rhizobium sp. 2MFCol3.1]|uniref:DUF2177 family protein n=1 Tax=Rhizobium sp. 2MFCol3.1 TaxID=1246459 RepID=UPI00037D8E0A|nr:DUF2177 family protein [Rhizobium sp. 2MFCol3.1]
MKAFGIAYIATLVSFLLIDAVWLGLLAKTFYSQHLRGFGGAGTRATGAGA